MIVFGLVDLVDREGRGSLIVFGLVYFVLHDCSRRPTERDRTRFGLFCAAWLIEKADRARSYSVWFILCGLVDREGRESVIVFGLVYFVLLG